MLYTSIYRVSVQVNVLCCISRLYAGPVYCGIGVLFIVIVFSALLMLN